MSETRTVKVYKFLPDKYGYASLTIEKGGQYERFPQRHELTLSTYGRFCDMADTAIHTPLHKTNLRIEIMDPSYGVGWTMTKYKEVSE